MGMTTPSTSAPESLYVLTEAQRKLLSRALLIAADTVGALARSIEKASPMGLHPEREELKLLQQQFLQLSDDLASAKEFVSSENATLVGLTEAMAARIKSLSEELAKPEDVRLREVLDVMAGREVAFDSLALRVTRVLDDYDELNERTGGGGLSRTLCDAVVLVGDSEGEEHCRNSWPCSVHGGARR